MNESSEKGTHMKRRMMEEQSDVAACISLQK